MSYESFFHSATGVSPYPYQVRLATQGEWPELLNVPTGAGKTEAALLAWLWRRRFHADEGVRSCTPRRLVYCLPVRTLVEQTRQRTVKCLAGLGLAASGTGDDQGAGEGAVAVHVLMGGEASDDWLLAPAADAVIIGTQDMLLSRALNRGYGLSRFRWPASFGLLNNDALWVLDEVQLMGSGLATSAQLAAFRETLGTAGNCRTMWMSATARPEWLETVDHPAPGPGGVMTLGTQDREVSALARRLQAAKTLSRHEASTPEKPAQLSGFARGLASRVLSEHAPGTLTLVIANTVARARAVHEALTRQASGTGDPELLLVHSRYRFYEREQLNARLTGAVDPSGPGLIATTTQVVEAGVDISARLLVTELAPWASLVQRFGRVNRAGEFAGSRVLWVDVPDRLAAPYDVESLQAAREVLQGLEGRSVSPANLPAADMPYVPEHVIRRRDIIGLFDTTPDLSGNNIDVSRFIRDGQNLDVTVFWRDFDGVPPDTTPLPEREELCPAPVHEVREFVKARTAWRWDHLDGEWRRVRPDQVLPGQVLLLRATDGSYCLSTGWDAEAREPVPVVGAAGAAAQAGAEATADDRVSYNISRWYTLVEHADHVTQEMELLLSDLQGLKPETALVLLHAARWHDLGKAHPVFQATLLAGVDEAERERRSREIWAKSAGRRMRHARPHFRHELASALAALAHGANDLVAYLVAAHHGRVRVTLRSLPGEKAPAPTPVPEPDGQDRPARYAFGIWDGDMLPAVDLGGGFSVPETMLDLGLMELGLTPEGQRSWTERMLALRDDRELGPFRLAYLEALLAAADRRASAREQRDAAGVAGQGRRDA